jgi:hypothetical protein
VTDPAFPLETYLQPVVDGLAITGLTLQLGPERLETNASPTTALPIVVWVPDVDSFAAGWQRDGVDGRMRLDAWCGLVCYLWGVDYSAVRELRRAVLNQLYLAFRMPGLRLISGSWLGVDEHSWLTNGRAYALRFAVREGIREVPPDQDTAEIDDAGLVPRDDSASGDNNLDFGEP